jgi:preprotein translocase SecE subunit
LPVLGDVSFNVLLSMIVIPAVVALLLIKYLNKPKIADFLIETETELRKVAWPSFLETRGAALVVIVSVVILMAFLAGADFLLSRVFDRILGVSG